MKKLFYYLTIALFMVAFCGCEEGIDKPNGENVPMITISETSITLDPEEGASTTVDIESNTSWSASSNKEWCTVSPNEGDGDKKITISATENTGEERTAIVTVAVSEEVKKTITVTQKGSGTGGDDTSVSKPVKLGTLLISDRNVGAPTDGVAYNYSNNPDHPDHKNSAFKGGYYSWKQATTACPDGWRLPTKEELEIIHLAYEQEGYLEMRRSYIPGDAGERCYFPHSGHSRLDDQPVGYYWASDQYFYDIEHVGYSWWFNYYMRTDQDGVQDVFDGWEQSPDHTYWFSVRCVSTVSAP